MPAGFVKDETETNEEYLATWDYEPWRKIILVTHRVLKGIDPEYQIAQIKYKFGGLRYYYDSKHEWGSPCREAMEAVVNVAERKVDALEREKVDG